MTAPKPVRVALINDYEMTAAGTAKDAGPHIDRVHVMEANTDSVSSADLDVVLFDDFASVPGYGVDLATLWAPDQAAISRALAAGASGVVSKALSASDIVTALVDVTAAKVVTVLGHAPSSTENADQWVPTDLELTPGETEVLALIARGLSKPRDRPSAVPERKLDQDLHPHAYTKIGARSRSQVRETSNVASANASTWSR